MSETIQAVLTWQTVLVLVAVMALYGLVPGVMLRLSVLMYPAGHERRAELVAELYTVPRRDRPMWALEQLETAVAEGALPRVAKTWRQPFRRLSVLLAVGAALAALLWFIARFYTSYLPAPAIAAFAVVYVAIFWAYMAVMPRRVWVVLAILLIVTATAIVVGPPSWMEFFRSEGPGTVDVDVSSSIIVLIFSGSSVLSWKRSVSLQRYLIRTRRAELRRRLHRRHKSASLAAV